MFVDVEWFTCSCGRRAVAVTVTHHYDVGEWSYTSRETEAFCEECGEIEKPTSQNEDLTG